MRLTIIRMNADLVLNIIAVVVSFIALTASAVIAVRQITIMRQSNQVPLFVELFQEFRSERFQVAERCIMNKVATGNTGQGVSGLPDDVRSAVNITNNYYGTLGALIMHGILEERVAVSMVGYRADQLWTKLESLIIAERVNRGSDDFASFFEDFVYRVRLHRPYVTSYGITIHRLVDLPADQDQPQQEFS